MCEVSSSAIIKALYDNNAPTFDGTFQGFVNDIISKSMFNIMSECKNATSSTQKIYSSCYGDSGNSDGCLSCTRIKNKLIDNRYKLELESYKISGRGIDSEVDKVELDCDIACRSCIVENLDQSLNLFASIDCFQDVKFVDDVKSKIDLNVKDFIKSKRDLFATVDLLNSSDSCVSNDLSTYIKNLIDAKLITRLQTQVQLIQNIDIKGRSIYMSESSQSINGRTLLKLIENESLNTNFYSSTSLTSAQQFIDINSTLSEMTKILLTPIIETSEIIERTITLTLLISVCLLLLFCLVVFLFLYVRK